MVLEVNSFLYKTYFIKRTRHGITNALIYRTIISLVPWKLIKKTLINFPHKRTRLITKPWYIEPFFSPFPLNSPMDTYFRSRNFLEFCPNSRKFKTRKILYWPIRESLCTRNFSISPNLLAALDNALVLDSWRKKSRRQCNTKTRSASVAIWVLENVWCTKTRPNTTKAWNNKVFFSLFCIWIQTFP